MEERRVAHASELFEVLKDVRLYEFLDEHPPVSVQELAKKLARSESRMSPDGKQRWLNWVVRTESGAICGYVQATVEETKDTNVAFVFGSNHQGKGIATAAVKTVLDLVSTRYDVSRFFILSEASNARSVKLAQRLGFDLASKVEFASRHAGPTEILFRKCALPH